MTAAEAKAFEVLSKKVDELTSAATVLTMAVKDAMEVKPAPTWFVKEFGNADLGGLIDTPKKTLVGWERITIYARLRGLGKGTKTK
ncbi:hypothetical protein [Cohnella boryungensis]|uniref:Uncharacterized protein n=1 Tax=Cohnella boryungensis TaxID=768479 RepID=A0ABV8SEV5_9BACL